MPRYKTLSLDDAETAIRALAGIEPIIVDGALVAVECGTLRIYADKPLKVSQEELTDAK